MDPNTPNFQTPPPAPPAWGQQPPAWNAAPPPASGGGLLSGMLAKIVGILVVVAIGVGVVVFGDKILNVNHRGEVVFTSTSQSVSDKCAISNRVTTIKAGDSVYVMVMWAHKMSADEKVVEEDFKDGKSLGTTDWSTSDYAGYDCTTVTADLKDVFAEAGTYEIKLTVGKDTVADGTLTVTAP